MSTSPETSCGRGSFRVAGRRVRMPASATSTLGRRVRSSPATHAVYSKSTERPCPAARRASARSSGGWNRRLDGPPQPGERVLGVGELHRAHEMTLREGQRPVHRFGRLALISSFDPDQTEVAKNRHERGGVLPFDIRSMDEGVEQQRLGLLPRVLAREQPPTRVQQGQALRRLGRQSHRVEGLLSPSQPVRCGRSRHALSPPSPRKVAGCPAGASRCCSRSGPRRRRIARVDELPNGLAADAERKLQQRGIGPVWVGCRPDRMGKLAELLGDDRFRRHRRRWRSRRLRPRQTRNLLRTLQRRDQDLFGRPILGSEPVPRRPGRGWARLLFHHPVR